ncbi:hypothetical protein ACLQ3K_22065 [Tsukamurella sp. DT100]|uniref:hypothetical protein n=1 Tax=Tsukamurella sp. DT100 TaxID=3393415 RepID=UPI003CECB0CE
MSDGGGDDDSRQTWVWAAGIVAVSVVGLVAGSQIARWAGQDVDWYTGFGQWLGAIASILAAGAALWIATSDRRRADRLARERQDEDDEKERIRLERVAALVRVEHGTTVPQFGEAVFIQIINMRSETIVDVQITEYVIEGHNWATTEQWLSDHVRRIPRTPDGAPRPLNSDIPANSAVIRHAAEVPESDPAFVPRKVPELVVVTYLDSAGLQWQVDSTGRAERIPDRHDAEA